MNEIEARIRGLSELRTDLTACPDYEAYWERTLAWNDSQAWSSERQECETVLQHVKAYKVVYEGYANTKIHGWYLVPNFSDKSTSTYPCMVHFHGYTGSKGQPEDFAAWLMMGYAVFTVDVRGQGGETGNNMSQDYGMARGWMTQGITDKDNCYYKGVTIDGLRAVDWASAQPEVDSERVILVGGSQGGGIVLLLSALHPNVRATIAEVPNMCRMDFGVLNSTSSLTEVGELLNRQPDLLKQALDTLSYFDIVNAADRITCPVFVSVGLKDTICMPETIFAAYNRIASEQKKIEVYPFAGHFTPPGHKQKIQAFLQPFL